MTDSVLVTGGAGYIGSHTVIELLAAGHSVVIVDNYDNSCPEAIKRVEELSGKKVIMYEVDLLDKPALDSVFAKHKFSGVIHFAGLKAVGESTSIPLRYYSNNITGTLNLLEVMKKYGVFNLIFSSSCTVYGTPKNLPIRESDPIGDCTNPYGKTKFFIEEMLRDLALSDKAWKIILLRYFNPIGAHKSGRIGEDPNGIPNNLLPFVTQVAVGRRPHVNVFGGDYDTKDGTGVRDYIHVVDLALGHMAALVHIPNVEGCVVYNLGTGIGVSVLEVIKATEVACGHEIKYVVAARRPGDVPAVWADPIKAETELKWKATRSLAEACADSWRWQSLNPNGFKTSA